MKRLFGNLIFIVPLLVLVACSGKGTSVSSSAGGIVITEGQKLTIDLEDVDALNITDYTVTLRSISPDFSTSTIIYDLTPLIQGQVSPNSTYSFVLPKAVQAVSPMLVVVDMPDLNQQLVDVLYANNFSSRPGIASTLTYTLMKYYPNKPLASYQGSDYAGIKTLAQAQVDQMLAQSEHLSLATVEYNKIIRYFTNGLAFNIQFLTSIQAFGVQYGFTPTTPPGLSASDTPENSLANYQYASAFTIGGVPANNPPFNQINNPTTLMQGASIPNPGTGLYVPEGRSVSMTSQAYDIDDDFIDKSIVVQYVPRVLPSSVTSLGTFPIIPEPTPEYTTITDLTGPSGIDVYTSNTIGFNEALDQTIYPTTLPFDPTLYPNATNTDTAYRNVYYLVSDGMVKVPYRWNFKYSDLDRQPQFVTDANNDINSTYFDTTLSGGEAAYPAGWQEHASHCETDPTATYTDPVTGGLTYYQPVHSRADGPWSCTFEVIDPDLDDDPNAAADTFTYTLNMYDNSTIATVNGTQLWPVYVGPPYNASRVTGTTIPTCTTIDGVTHRRCGIGLYQITIDNSVKVAAESKSNVDYVYDIVVYDRTAAVGGLSITRSIQRQIQFLPNPARLVNYETPSPPVGTGSLSLITTDSNGNNIYLRQDTYLSELLAQANSVYSTSTQPLTTFDQVGFNSSMAGASNRSTFLAGTAEEFSPYITQPHVTLGGTLTLDPVTEVGTAATPGTLNFLGSSLTTAAYDLSTYKTPREYDSTCGLTTNNMDTVAGWDQATPKGWTFEMDAIDYDNVGLRVGEPTDPVNISFSTDVATSLNSGGILFCSYNNPNSDPAYYQTYAATANATAVNAETCSWQANPPASMQPIPIYYTVKDGSGNTVVQKLVYHRLRVKWQPKDQGLTGGKTQSDPPGYIKNLIKTGLKLSGQRYQQLGDMLDQSTFTSSMGFYAIRKNMASCMNGLSRGSQSIIHQLNPSPTGISFSVADENKTLAGSPGSLGAVSGRFEAELKMLGTTRIITSADFLKFVPYLENCTTEDVADPTPTPSSLNYVWSAVTGATNYTVKYSQTAGQSATGTVGCTTTGTGCTIPNLNTLSTYYFTTIATLASSTVQLPENQVNIGPGTVPTKTVAEAAIWYAKRGETVPRIRFRSSTDPQHGQFCFSQSLSPLKVGAVPYNEVWVIHNLNTTTPYTLNNALLGTCTARSSIQVNPDQEYLVIASTCGSGHVLTQSIWSDANSTANVYYLLDPTLASNGGYPSGTTLTMDLMPTFYQADLAKIFPAGFESINALFFDAYPFDNFYLDTNASNPTYQNPIYSGFGTWLPTNSTYVDPSPTPSPSPAFVYGVQVIDWDSQPNFMSLTTPTPNNNVFVRTAPGDSTTIQVYMKQNSPTTYAPALFPIKTTDVPATTAVENDPFDIMQFTLKPPTPVPAATPYFTGNGARTDCVSAPINYPAVSTLVSSSLSDYKTCSFNWTPAIADAGKKFAYTFTVQDNMNALVSPSPSPGIGGRHPAGVSSIIPSDSLANTNGPTVTYNLALEAIETNVAPFFTGSTGTALSMPYTGIAGAAGWSSVFSSTNGIQPSGCSTQSGFSCSLSISSANQDTLQSSTAISMTEGTQQSFVVYAKDSNVTSALKTLTATPPRSVLIVDGPHQGRTFTVPSFASLTLSTVQNVTAGTANFTFKWTPTDAEANYLSNPGGFLIPIVVSDQAYAAATDSGFPSNFVVPAMSSTVWIWATLSVLNNSPQVYYLNGTTEVPLAGTLTMQTGATTNFTIRVKDSDVARWTQSGERTGFFSGNPYTGPAFTSALPAGTPYLSTGSPQYVVQEFVISGTPANSDIGTYSSPAVTVTDPGDPSLGLAINPDLGSPPRAQVAPFTTPFSIQVIGKPIFLAPSLTNYQAYAYASRPFSYPLSLSVSRPTELQQAFFIGIDSSTAVTPVKRATTGATSTGLYVNEKFVLKWPDSTAILIGAARTVPLYGILKTYCSAATAAKTLIRYNETTGLIETCKISASDLSNNASAAGSVAVTLVDNSTLVNPPSLTETEVDRTYTPVPTPAPATVSAVIDEQFSDFYGRCTNCSSASLLTSNTSPSTSSFFTTPYSAGATGTSGSATYSYNSFKSIFTFDTTSGLTVQKNYQDLAPTPTRTISLMASKGETLSFLASPSGGGSLPTPYTQYRWYVNGCLKQSGYVTGPQISYSLPIGSLMSGANNDCTGEYGFTETGGANLGQLVVRLSLDNGTELLTTSESSSTYYLWNVSVLNTNPNVVTASTYTPSTPAVLTSTYMTGNQNIQFGIPVAFAGKNYFAFTDQSNSSSVGLKVRLREINTNGDIPTTGSNLVLNCNGAFTTQAKWIGLQPEGSTLYISVSNNNSYPIGSVGMIDYAAVGQTCYTNALTLASPTQSYVSYSGPGSSVPAGFLAFSKYDMAVRSIASYSTEGSIYTGTTTDNSDYYLIDGTSGTNQFWSNDITNNSSIYGSTPAELSSPFTTNVVTRNIVSSNNLFQMIGSPNNTAAGWRGFILIRSLAPNSSNLVASGTNRIMFSDGTGPAPTPVSSDCQFNGTPVDGVYSAANDTLYVLAYANDVTTKGHFVAITNATSNSPSCHVLGNVMNPSLLTSDHNPNISKMVFDSTHGMIYGIVNQGSGLTSEFYSYDIYTQQLVTRDLSSTIYSYEIVYSPLVNSLFLFDNRKTTAAPLYNPTLYKIW